MELQGQPVEAEALGGGRGKGVASSGSAAVAVPVGLNTVSAREDPFAGLFTTDSDNVGGRDRVQVWVWVGLIRLDGRPRWALMGAGVGRGTRAKLRNPSHSTEKWADFTSGVVGEDYRLGKQGEK